MTNGTCIEKGCDRRRHCVGLCGIHYGRYRMGKLTLSPAQITQSNADRFWAKVDRRGLEECWPWIGGLNGDGYGTFRPGSTTRCIAASRYSWMLAHPTRAIAPTVFVCHRCDNPACVNPTHLFLGTVQRNNADKAQKGRGRTGSGPRRLLQPRRPPRLGAKPQAQARGLADFAPGPSERVPWVAEAAKRVPRVCSVEECGRVHDALGYCAMHYKRWKAHGSTETRKGGKPRQPRTADQVRDRIATSVIVSSTGCWEWQHGRTAQGYSSLTWQGMTPGHRVSYAVHIGPIPPALFVCHRCDNRICVNPEHMFLGTAAENNADMYAKGRGRGGSQAIPLQRRREIVARRRDVKLTEAQAAEIRASADRGVDLAAKYGVAQQTICNIRKGRRWPAPQPRQS
jgi:hypothetical protein